MRHLNQRHFLGWAGLAAIAAFAAKVEFVPQSWPTIGAGIWLLYLLQKGLGNLSQFIIAQAGAFFISAFAFITLVQLIEPTFSGWADVFFFCGKNFEFCNCNLSWNLLGAALLNFDGVPSSDSPGEEYIDHEALQTVFIRLIPYWFNNWEQQWGVECSSLLFELPHFAIELLVILPLVQVICRRLRPLVATRVRIPTPLASMLASHGIPVEVPYQPEDRNLESATAGPDATAQTNTAEAEDEAVPLQDPDTPLKAGKTAQNSSQDLYDPIRSATDILALDATRGEWVLDARQRRLLPRLQANIGSVCVCFALLATAVVNVLTMPLLLDTAVFTHARAHTVLLAADDSSITSGYLHPWDHLIGDGLVPSFSLTEPQAVDAHNGTCPHPQSHFAALELQTAFLYGRPHMRQRPCAAYSVTERRSPWLPDRKSSQQVLSAAMQKNSQELQKMRSWKHRRLVIAIELLLVAMRLSCEGFPVLFATYAAYILRVPARVLAALVRTVSSASFVLQCTLYLFPAICWVYGAGVLFSMFVSVVFWAAPVWTAYEYVASTIFVVAPLVVAKPGLELMERAGPQCAICWSTFDCGVSGSLAGGGSQAVTPTAAEGDSAAGSSTVMQVGGGDGASGGLSGGASNPLSAVAELQQQPQPGPARQQRKRRRRWFSLGRQSSGDSDRDAAGGCAAGAAVAEPPAAVTPRATAGADGAAGAAAAAAVAPLARHANSSQHALSLHALGAAGTASGTDIPRQTSLWSSGAVSSPEGALPPTTGLSPASSSTMVADAVSPRYSDLDKGSRSASSDTPLAGLREPGDGWDGLAEPISSNTCERDTVVCTKCRHVFHFGCLSHWLHQCMVGMRATVCPLCQRTIDVDVVINPMMLFRKGRLDGVLPMDDGGQGLDETDDEELAGDAANASYATVDFLGGLMPPPGALHLAHYPSANPPPPPVPFVTRLNHDAQLLRVAQGRPPLRGAPGGAAPLTARGVPQAHPVEPDTH